MFLYVFFVVGKKSGRIATRERERKNKRKFRENFSCGGINSKRNGR